MKSQPEKPKDKSKPRVTLRLKLLVIFLGVISLFIGLFSRLSLDTAETMIRREISHALQSDNQLIASEIENWLFKNDSDLNEVTDLQSPVRIAYAKYNSEKSEENIKLIRNQLDSILFHKVNFIRLSLLDSNTGEILVSTTPHLEGKFDEQYAISRISTVYYSEELGAFTIEINKPFRNPGGDISEILKANINIRSLGDILLNRPGFDETGEAYLISDQGFHILGLGKKKGHYKNFNEDKKALKSQGIDAALSRQSGISEYLNYDGELVYGTYQFLPNLGVALVQENESEELFASLALLKKKIALIASLIFIASALLVYLLIARITLPISSLTAITKEITEGNFRKRAKVSTNDEIGVLAYSFNQMTDSLVNSLEEISFSSALLQSQYDASLDGILALGTSGEILSANKNFAKLWKIPKNTAKKKNGPDVLKIMEKNLIDPKNFKQKLQYFEIHQKNISHDQFELKTGKILHSESAPLIGKNGQYFGRVFYFRDITKEAEIDRAKSEFVSLASHQLQTPLTAIKWLLEILIEKETKDKEKKELLLEAFKSNERMIRLVNDFLNVSRLDMGSISADSKHIDYNSFIKELVSEARILAKEKNITIKNIDCPDKIEISLDKGLISLVILNLLSNAIRYSDTNTQINVSTKLGKDKIEIAINDNGIGISEDEQEKLFGKFYRTDSARDYSTTGSGLGLYLCQKVMNVLKGSIRVISEKGMGSTFYIVLPLEGPINKKRGAKSLIARGIMEL